MIPVDTLLYKIDQKLNKLSSNAHQRVQLEDKILALNEAQISLVKVKLDGISVASQLGADAFRKRYADLQYLVEDYNDHPLGLELVDKNLNQWDADLLKLSPMYMFYLGCYILADKGSCKDRMIWINNDLFKHGDVQFLLNNDNFKPSFEYQETFNSISKDKLSIFTDGSFTPTKLHLMYIRYPKYINKTGYVMLDGEASVTTDCELDSQLEDELLDLTVKNLAMYTENVAAAQSAQQRIQTSE